MFSVTTPSQHRQPCRSPPQAASRSAWSLVAQHPFFARWPLGADPGSASFLTFLALHWPHFGDRSGGVVRAEMKVSMRSKSLIGQNTNPRLSWEQVNIHSTFQGRIERRLPFAEKGGRYDGAHLAASPSCPAPCLPGTQARAGLGLEAQSGPPANTHL